MRQTSELARQYQAGGSIPRTAYVFHVSQTEADERRVS